TFEDLAGIIGRVRRAERVGICLDTCHLFVAGYDIRTPTGYAAAMERCARTVGLGRVLAFHLNDASAPLGSGLDRHEHIGRGRLGLRPFRLLLNDRRFARVPKVLETPKEPEATAERAGGARRATGRQRRADVLAERDEQVVVADPEAPG